MAAERRRAVVPVAVEHRDRRERRSGEDRRVAGERRNSKSRKTAPFVPLAARDRVAASAPQGLADERRGTSRRRTTALRQSTEPLLQIRQRLLIVPVVGELSAERARGLSNHLLRGIRVNRAKVVVMDVTGVPTIDSTVADYLMEAVEASRLLGATVIVTGVSQPVAATLVGLDVSPARLITAGDLQAGLEQAERLLRDRGPGLAGRPDVAL